MRLILSPASQRDLRRVAPEVYRRVIAALHALADTPRPSGCLLLRNQEPPTWRIRVGDWRVLYEVDDRAGIVRVRNVYHRREAYRR